MSETAIIAAALTAAASLTGGYMANQAGAQNVAMSNNAAFQIADANRRDQHAQYDTNWERSLTMDDRNKNFAQSIYNQQVAYNRDMANTAYRRAMVDMRASGLNPMLAYQQGGAATPTASGSSPAGAVPGSSPMSTVPHFEAFKPRDPLGPAASSAVQAAHVVQGIRQTQATTDLTRAETRVAEARESETRANTLLRVAEEVRSRAEAARLKNAARTEAERPDQVRADAQRSRAAAGLDNERERTQAEETRAYRESGRPGVVGSAASSARAVGEAVNRGPLGDAARAAGSAVGGAAGRVYYNWGSGSRYPSQPGVPRMGTMDFLY